MKMFDFKDKDGNTNWWHVAAVGAFALGMALCIAGLTKVWSIADAYQRGYECRCMEVER